MSSAGPVVDAARDPVYGRVILIVGVHRSGTTWLQQLLLGHPRVGGLERTETWLFHALVDLWSNVRGLGEPRLDTYMSPAEGMRALRSFCDRAIEGVLSEKPTSDHFLERTPRHSWHLDLVADLYPDAWVIHIIRDGRHVVQSALDLEFGASDLRGAARFWRETIEVVRRDSVLFDRYRELRYEALVRDPVAETVTLLEWIGLDVDDDARDEITRRAGERVSQWNITGPVGAGNRSRLTDAELRVVYQEAGSMLAELGYIGPDELATR